MPPYDHFIPGGNVMKVLAVMCLLTAILGVNLPVLAVESPRAIEMELRAEDAAARPPTDFLFFNINYLYRSQGAGPFQTLEEGSVLRSGDHYKIIFTPNQDCYVYIFQVDSANMVYSLFPMEQFGALRLNHVNPARAGQTYYLPAEGQSFVLDEQTGVERLYFLAAFEPDLELEAASQRAADLHKQRDLEAQLQHIDRLLHDALRLHGATELVAAPDDGEMASWQEGGETFLVLRQRLENLCDGCVHVLTFMHE
jgi:hypothetical protein